MQQSRTVVIKDDKRSLVRHRITLSRTKTKLIVNKAHSIFIDNYDYQTDLTDIFNSKSGI